MLNALSVNLILDAWYYAIESRFEKVDADFYVGTPAVPEKEGGYGAITLTALVTGAYDGKITLTMDFDTLLAMYKEIENKELEAFNDDVKDLADGLINTMKEKLAELFEMYQMPIQVVVLPTLLDTNILYTIRNNEVLALPLHSKWGKFEIILSLKNMMEETHAA